MPVTPGEITSSSIPDVIDYLIEQFTASEGLAGATISDGHPLDRTPDMVVIGETGQPTTDGPYGPAAIGGKSFEEKFVVSMMALSSAGLDGEDEFVVQSLVRRTAWWMFECCWRAIQADLSLGGLLTQSWVQNVVYHQTDPEDATQGRIAEVHFDLFGQARHTLT